MGYFALPYFIDRTWQRIKQKLGWQHFIPKEYFVLNERLVDKELTEQKDSVNSPGWRLYNELAKNKDKVVGVPIQDVNSQWISDGSDIKSAVPFRQNYEALVAIANKMKARLILSTYAYYLPVDYSLEKFLYQKLDYTEQRWPVEIYGLPNNVVKGLNATNEIIRKLHTVNPALLYFDFENAIPHNGQYFNDICHLTSMGCSLLTDSLAVKIRNE